MVTIEIFRKLALAFPDAHEQPHFEKASFRVGSKIFATLDAVSNRACLMLTVVDQSVFCAFDKSIIYSVPINGDKRVPTFVKLETVPKSMLKDALEQAYNKIAKK